MTGSYNNHFVIHHVPSLSTITVEALKDPPKRKPPSSQGSRPTPSPPAALKPGATAAGATSAVPGAAGVASAAVPAKGTNILATSAVNEATPDIPNVNLMDFGKKALHVSYHPNQHVIAVAGLNKLYIYQAINATP